MCGVNAEYFIVALISLFRINSEILTILKTFCLILIHEIFF